MPTSTARQLILLGAAAIAPIALGVAMHLEHAEAERACMAHRDASPAPEVVAHVVPVPTPWLEPAVAPPVDDRAGAYAFAFVVDVPTPHLMLASATELGEAAFEAMATGAPHYRGEAADGFIDHPVWRDVALDRLPDRARDAVGRHVRVYSAAGRVCVARIGRPVAVSERFGSISYMDDEDVSAIEDDQGTVVDPASLWDDGRRSLVAPLEGVGCEGGIWARDVALPEALVYVAQDVESPEDLPSPVARRRVQRSAVLRPISEAFAKHVEGFADEAFTTRRFVDRLEGRRWIEPTRGGELDVFASDGEEFGGCGGFDPAWAAIGVADDGELGDVVWADAQTDYVAAVFDLDADGRPEVLAHSWLGPTRVFALDDTDGVRPFATLDDVPLFGCPC